MSMRQIYSTWWPLAASWMLMGVELPVVSAVMARLPAPEINLAAYGGVVFALALIIEAPIIMLLAASTALSRDWEAYQKLRRFMMISGAALTVLHALIAFTPLFDLVVGGMIGAPPEIQGPARTGLMIMVPWTWAIAYRRFNQGVLIRFGHSRAVGLGTLIRLIMVLSVLIIGYTSGNLPGIVVGTSAVITGVLGEAVYAGWRVRPVIRFQLQKQAPKGSTLTLKTILDFYLPLAMTSLLFLLVQPMVSAALSRLPNPIQSLAVWPVISGLIFIVRSLGIAYNEVVVALLDEPGSEPGLRRFAIYLGSGTTALMLVLTLTPLARAWFADFSALHPDLVELALKGLWIAIPLPGLTVVLNWFQGVLTNQRHTRPVTEAVVIYLVISAFLLAAGVSWGRSEGLYVALLAFTASVLAQTAWMGFRSRRDRGFLQARDRQSTLSLSS